METNRQKWPRWWVLTVFALALGVRMGAANLLPFQTRQDPDGYLQLGFNVCRQHIYGLRNYYNVFHLDDRTPVPTAYRPPLYPLVIAGCCELGDRELNLLVAVHVMLGAATATIVLLIGERWNLSKRGALLAAALVALDPVLLNQAAQPMTETLAAFMAVLGLFALTVAGSRLSLRWSMLAGGILAAAVLCRPTFLPWLLLSALGLALSALGWRRRVAVSGAFALAAALVISPWAVRNYRLFGQPIITTTHGGFTLALANNPQFYEHLSHQGWFVPWSETKFAKPTPADVAQGFEFEVEMDRERYAEAVQTIRAQPGMFSVSCAYRLGRLWGVCPMATDPQESAGHRWLRYGVAGFYLFEFALAGWGAWLVGRNWLRSPWLWGLLLVLSFTAVHTCYWTDMRMRAPFIPVIALAAGAALSGTGWRSRGQGLAAQGVANTQSAANLP